VRRTLILAWTAQTRYYELDGDVSSCWQRRFWSPAKSRSTASPGS